MREKFTGSFTQQEPIPQEGIDSALAVLRHGRLHRYNIAGDEAGEAALLEQEFAALTGAKYTLAVASGGYALGCALRALGVIPGDRVLANAFTLAPVPGAIAGVGAEPVFVEITGALVLDFEDLVAKAENSDANVLMLSHMRGHICDMDRLMEIAAELNLKVVEDCAHTMGGAWNSIASGRHGVMACYSTQTYKHINSGEGGFLTGDDDALMARAVMLSGSYMLYDRHLAAPPPDAFADLRYETPNISGRMDNLRAAILRSQLKALQNQCDRWNERYRIVEDGLRDTPGLQVIERPEAEGFVGSSIQFLLAGWDAAQIKAVLARCLECGVELKWFGGAEPTGFTSRHDSWRYARAQSMPQTDAVLAGLMDMRIPLTFSPEDCALIARIIRAEVSAVWQGRAAP